MSVRVATCMLCTCSLFYFNAPAIEKFRVSGETQFNNSVNEFLHSRGVHKLQFGFKLGATEFTLSVNEDIHNVSIPQVELRASYDEFINSAIFATSSSAGFYLFSTTSCALVCSFLIGKAMTICTGIWEYICKCWLWLKSRPCCFVCGEPRVKGNRVKLGGVPHKSGALPVPAASGGKTGLKFGASVYNTVLDGVFFPIRKAMTMCTSVYNTVLDGVFLPIRKAMTMCTGVCEYICKCVCSVYNTVIDGIFLTAVVACYWYLHWLACVIVLFFWWKTPRADRQLTTVQQPPPQRNLKSVSKETQQHHLSPTARFLGALLTAWLSITLAPAVSPRCTATTACDAPAFHSLTHTLSHTRSAPFV